MAETPEHLTNVNGCSSGRRKFADVKERAALTVEASVRRTGAAEGLLPATEHESRERRKNQKALNAADVPLEIAGRSGKGTEELPYHFYRGAFVCNSGCIGFRSGNPSENFDPLLARMQLRNLAKSGITKIVCFVQQREIKQIGEELRAEGVSIDVMPRYIHASDYSLRSGNERLFYDLAPHIGPATLIFCRHGCHRAIVATVGALIASEKARTFGEAFEQAGGVLSNFPYQYAAPMLGQAIEFARKKGVSVEPQFSDFVENMRTQASTITTKRIRA